MTARKPPRGTFDGRLRWYVYRGYTSDAPFGARRGRIAWMVSPIVQGRGSRGLRIGAPTICANRDAALAYAHNQAHLAYRPKDTRQ